MMENRVHFSYAFDARGYRQLAEALQKRKVPSRVLGENWLRILDAAKAP